MLKKILLYGFPSILSICILMIVSIIGFFYLWKNNINGQYNVLMTGNVPTLQMPIKNNREAIIYAINNKIFEAPDSDLVNKAHEEPVIWSLSAYEHKDIWSVSLRTQNVIPTYSCIMKMDEIL